MNDRRDDRSAAELIAQAKEATARAKADLLKTFEFVPEDRLAWSPSPTARTPLWIVAHCGASNAAFAAILRGEPLPMPPDPAEAAALIRAGGRETATRLEAVRSVEDSTADIIRALDAVTAARIVTSPESPLGPLPFTVWMQVPAIHMMGHARQLDYLQTIWGDVDYHTQIA
ncbi:MAG: DinB family protein [Armatimonadetes bacterium]|nr:DinB family protein [Armatimonadota bacterium]